MSKIPLVCSELAATPKFHVRRLSDGYLWTGADYEDETGLTDAELESALLDADVVSSGDTTFIRYELDLSAFTVPVSYNVYNGAYSVGMMSSWDGQYDPRLANLSGDAYAYLGTNLGANGANATEAGGTGDQFSAIPDMATATNQATIAGYIDEEVAAIVSELAKVPKSDGGVTWNETALASINTQCDTALSDINLDHLMKVGDATLTNIVVDNTALAHLLAIGGDVSDYSNETQSLEALQVEHDATQAAIAALQGEDGDTLETLSDQLDAVATAVDSIVPDTGDGANSHLFTVTNDSDVALEDATIRVQKGSTSYQTTTDENGEATFNLANGTWTWVATCSGCTGSTGTFTSDADEDPVDIELTAITFTAPSSDNQVVGYIYTRNEDDSDVEAGVTVYLRCTSPPTTPDGVGLPRPHTDTSDANGLVTFNLWKTAKYQYKIGKSGQWFSVTIASDATSPLALTSIHA